jgi:glycine/D-amino acid oxidase-like deaminating enzyme
VRPAPGPRIGIVGAGLGGSLLAWRLLLEPGARPDGGPAVRVELYDCPRSAANSATAWSGGLTRGFDPDPVVAADALAGMAELAADPGLAAAAGFRPSGSLVLLPPGADPAGGVRRVEDAFPGSARVLEAGQVQARWPVRGLPAGTTAVWERQAGHFEPARLRDAVLGRLAANGTRAEPVPVRRVAAGGAVELADGRAVGHDLLVVAAGPWTPGLLAAGDLPAGRLRTKEIRYQRCALSAPGLPPFVDEGTGLYGRPLDARTFLLGLPSERWDADPDRGPGPDFTAELLAVAQARLTGPVAGGPAVHATDCYADPSGLRIRLAGPAVVTFSGGSGGAAKTALAASRRAAREVAELAQTAAAPGVGTSPAW